MPVCPLCGSRDARRSRRRGALDVIQRWRGLCRYRCRECKSRYYAPYPVSEVRRARKLLRRHRRPRHRLAFELLLFLLFVTVFYSILHWLRG